MKTYFLILTFAIALCVQVFAATVTPVDLPIRSFPIHNDGASPPVYDTLTNNTLVKIGSDGAILNATAGKAIGIFIGQQGGSASAKIGIVKLFAATSRAIQSASVTCGSDVMQDPSAVVKVLTAATGGKIVGTKIYPATSGSAGDIIEIILSPVGSYATSGNFDTLTVTNALTSGSLTVVTNAAVGGTLTVTGASALAGAVTATSVAVTNAATVGTTLGVTGISTLTGGAVVGGGATVLKVLSAASELDFPAIGAGSITNLTITVTGAGTNSTVHVGMPPAIESGIMVMGYVSSTNTVTIRAANVTAGSINPASGSFRATVVQY